MEEGKRQQVGIFITVLENITVNNKMLNEVKKITKGKEEKNVNMKLKAVFFSCKPAKSLFKGP